MKRILVVGFSLCTFYFSTAQNIIPRFESLGVNEGLPHSSVYSILQDKKGFMWFGTADGLCRYDGTELKTFKYLPLNEQDVVNNFVRGEILEDQQGNIWYSNESGIYKWDIYKELVFRVRAFKKEEYDNAGLQAVYLDEKGCIWVFNYLYGLLEVNTNTGNIKTFPLPNKINNSIVILNYTITNDKEKVWLKVGSKTDPFIVFDKKTKKYSTRFIGDPPQAIFFDKYRHILAYEDKLVYQNLNGNNAVTIPKIINGKNISFFSFDGVSDNYGRLWMTARGNGLYSYDEKNNLFTNFQHSNSIIKSLPFDLTTCLFIDRNENLWIGIDGAGVAKLDLKQPKFNLFPLSEGDYPILNDYFTKCFYEDDQGRIWFGSQNNGLNIYDPITKSLKNFHHDSNRKNSLPGNMVGSIFKDREGNMWIGSSGGISIFKEADNSFQSIHISGIPKLYPLLNNLVYKMIQLEDGDFLVATIIGIIKIIKEKDGSFRGHYFADNNTLISLTTDVVEMPGNIIYATLPGLGLYKYKKDGNGYKMMNRFLNGIDLRSVRKDENLPGYLWIGGGKGLIHFNTLTNKYQVWNEENGIANSYVYGSLEDSSGNLWVSTNKGLSYLNRKENRFTNYSFQDGLQSNEFNTQSFYKSSSGNFYFGGIRGFNWFKPEYVNKDILKPIAAITKIEVNNEIYQRDSLYFVNNTITVPYLKNDFNFQFAALDFTRPEANNVQYILEGWENTPVITKNKSARYSNLPPGRYTFRVKVSNANGIWSDEEKIIIHIASPFWKTTWFMAMVFFLLLLAIVLTTANLSQQAAKRKLRLLEKQIAIDVERNRISADMHDEIGSGITHIALLSELIQTQHKEEKEFKKDINIIATSARKLVQAMSEIIWAMNPQNDSLENLLAYTREQSQQYFESMDIKFDISFPEQVPELKLSNVQRRNLYLVTREALNNAMKHSSANHIRLTLNINKQHITFSVIDNGVGMNDKKIRTGSNGISNMKKRMKDIDGIIEWLPLEKGTAVTYSLTI